MVALGRGGALDTVIDGETGVLVPDTTVESLADGPDARRGHITWDAARIRAHAERFSRERFITEIQRHRGRHAERTGGPAMVKRHNRLLVAFHVVTDAVLGMAAFVLAYLLRFETGLIAITRGQPPIEQYFNVLPFIALVVPIGFHFQGLYRLRRGRSRIDDFFNVLVGSIFAVVLGMVARCISRPTTRPRRSATSAPTKCRASSGASSSSATSCSGTCRASSSAKRSSAAGWRASGLRRILIAGAGDLGRVVADRMLEHRELGYQIVGFVDDKAGGDHLGYRGLPLLGSLSDAADIVANEKIDHLYVALPLEEHMKLLDLVESTSREGVDVKVVPDLLQFIALRARLEDLDGVPVINLNDVPLQGVSAFIKRVLDIVISAGALAMMALPGLLI